MSRPGSLKQQSRVSLLEKSSPLVGSWVQAVGSKKKEEFSQPLKSLARSDSEPDEEMISDRSSGNRSQQSSARGAPRSGMRGGKDSMPNSARSVSLHSKSGAQTPPSPSESTEKMRSKETDGGQTSGRGEEDLDQWSTAQRTGRDSEPSPSLKDISPLLLELSKVEDSLEYLTFFTNRGFALKK